MWVKGDARVGQRGCACGSRGMHMWVNADAHVGQGGYTCGSRGMHLVPKPMRMAPPPTEATTTPPIPLPTNPTHLLDLLLTYLWRVHGVDYYGCREYGGPDDPTRVGARRTLRPPPSTATSTAAAVKKEEGDGGAGAAGDGGDGGDGGLVKQEEKEGMDQDAGNGAAAGGDGDGDGKAGAAADAQHSVAAGVKKSDQEEGDAQIKLLDELWGHRLDMEDVLEKPLQKQRVEDAIQEWVEAQVVKHEENKYAYGLTFCDACPVGC